MINPFIGESRITTEIEKRAKDVDISIVTRSHKNALSTFKKNFKEVHSLLTKNGVNIVYDDKIHAKIFIFDGVCAITSSMNLFHYSNEHSLEAGTLTFNEAIIDDIQQYFSNFEN